MRRVLRQACCAVSGPKDAFVPGSSLSVSSSGGSYFDQGTVCNTVRYLFAQRRAPLLHEPLPQVQQVLTAR